MNDDAFSSIRMLFRLPGGHRTQVEFIHVVNIFWFNEDNLPAMIAHWPAWFAADNNLPVVFETRKAEKADIKAREAEFLGSKFAQDWYIEDDDAYEQELREFEHLIAALRQDAQVSFREGDLVGSKLLEMKIWCASIKVRKMKLARAQAKKLWMEDADSTTKMAMVLAEGRMMWGLRGE